MDKHLFKIFRVRSLIEQISDADMGHRGGEESSERKNLRA
jgi:hypothetical protein